MYINLINGDSVEIDERYLELIKAGKTIKDTSGCYIPAHAFVSVCEAESDDDSDDESAVVLKSTAEISRIFGAETVALEGEAPATTFTEGLDLSKDYKVTANFSSGNSFTTVTKLTTLSGAPAPIVIYDIDPTFAGDFDTSSASFLNPVTFRFANVDMSTGTIIDPKLTFRLLLTYFMTADALIAEYGDSVELIVEEI